MEHLGNTGIVDGETEKGKAERKDERWNDIKDCICT